MAKALEQTSETKIPEEYSDILVCMQPGKDENTPVFLLHPISGTVYSYRPLVQALQDDIPMYGIQARGMDGERELLADINSMADLYTKAILAIQPDGSYQLIGHSMGGILAFEIAQRLKGQGKKVHLLCMIDTAVRDDFTLINTEAEIISYLLDQQLGIAYDDSLKKLNQMEKSANRIAYYINKMSGKEQSLASINEIEQVLKHFQNSINLALRYQPETTYTDPVLQFRALEESRFNANKPEQSWKHWIENWELHDIPGNHITMVEEPHVRKIAEILNSKLL